MFLTALKHSAHGLLPLSLKPQEGQEFSELGRVCFFLAALVDQIRGMRLGLTVDPQSWLP